MIPLPRLLALTDTRVAALADLGVRAAALAAAGPAVALVARLPGGSTDALVALAQHLRTLVRPPMAQLMVTGRADVARSAHGGVILRRNDLRPQDVRPLMGNGSILASVHSEEEAEVALTEGADGLLLGTIWASASHPERAGAGIGLVKRVVALGRPTWAIGGVTAARAIEAADAGAYGVASIGAAWDAAHPYQAALELTAPWRMAA